jgi:hypothetical protein
MPHSCIILRRMKLKTREIPDCKMPSLMRLTGWPIIMYSRSKAKSDGIKEN